MEEPDPYQNMTLSWLLEIEVSQSVLEEVEVLLLLEYPKIILGHVQTSHHPIRIQDQEIMALKLRERQAELRKLARNIEVRIIE